MRGLYALLLTLFATPALADVPVYDGASPVAYLLDMSSGAVLVNRDGQRSIPTASMAKMMTAYVVFDAIKAGKIDPATKFVVTARTWKAWNNTGSTMFLKANEKVSVENLLYGLLTLSGNDAAVVLAEGISGSEADFTKEMNSMARQLGMKDSRFRTANGWPDGGQTYSTAHDLALLSQRIIADHPKLFAHYFAKPAFRWNNVTQGNRNPLLGAVVGADGLKTGHSDEAGYCLAGTARRGDRRLVMVIAGLPTSGSRLTEARRLMEWGFTAWRAEPLFRAGQTVAEIPVQLGNDSRIALVAPRALAASLPSAANGKVKIRVRFKGPVRAPFKKGDELAQLVAKLPNGQEQLMPLVAAHSVAEAGFFGRAWNGLKSVVGA